MTNPNYSSSKPPQTSEQSLKYLAWDIKQVAKSLESLPEISRHLAALNFKLESLLKPTVRKEVSSEIPF